MDYWSTAHFLMWSLLDSILVKKQNIMDRHRTQDLEKLSEIEGYKIKFSNVQKPRIMKCTQNLRMEKLRYCFLKI